MFKIHWTFSIPSTVSFPRMVTITIHLIIIISRTVTILDSHLFQNLNHPWMVTWSPQLRQLPSLRWSTIHLIKHQLLFGYRTSFDFFASYYWPYTLMYIIVSLLFVQLYVLIMRGGVWWCSPSTIVHYANTDKRLVNFLATELFKQPRISGQNLDHNLGQQLGTSWDHGEGLVGYLIA